MTRDELYSALVRLCQEFGYTSDDTYDRIDDLIDSIGEDVEDDD